MTIFILMSLASYRLWRIVGLDTWAPSEGFRNWLQRRHEVNTAHAADVLAGPGESVRFNRRANLWAQVDEMVQCPWCLGAWVSFAVVAVTAQLTSVPLPVLQVLAVSCLVGLIGGGLDGE